MQAKPEFYTYLYRDVDGTPVYAGKGRGNRAFFHIHLKNQIGELIRKRKAEGYELLPEIVIRESEEDAFTYEKELIAQYGRLDLGTGTLFNQTNGGDGFRGIGFSEETKIKRSRALKGRISPTKGKQLSNDTKQKMSAASKGKPKSVEHRAEMAKAQKRRITDEECRRRSERMKKFRAEQRHQKVINTT